MLNCAHMCAHTHMNTYTYTIRMYIYKNNNTKIKIMVKELTCLGHGDYGCSVFEGNPGSSSQSSFTQKKTPFGKRYCCKTQGETLQDPETNGCIRMGRVPALLCAWLTMQAMLGFRVHPSLPLASASVCQSFPLLTSSRSSPASPLNSLLTFWQLRFKNRSFDFDIFKFLLSLFQLAFLAYTRIYMPFSSY